LCKNGSRLLLPIRWEDVARCPNPDVVFLRTCHVFHDDLAIAAEYVLGTADQEASPENRNKLSSLPRVRALELFASDAEIGSLIVPLVLKEDLYALCLGRPVVRALSGTCFIRQSSSASGNLHACAAVIVFPRNDRVVFQGLQIRLLLV
jgi:hypothetical protein